jgi:transposase InsO family protein
MENYNDIKEERRRLGYHRLRWLLGREGVAFNHKKFRRLYREEQLQVRRRGSRKRALGTRAPTGVQSAPPNPVVITPKDRHHRASSIQRWKNVGAQTHR